MQRLARQFGVALYIQYVVGNLEGEAYIAGIAFQMRAAFGWDMAEDRAHFDAGGNQRAGLQRLQPRYRGQVKGRLFRLQIHHLSARHAIRATGQRQRRNQLAADEGVGVGARTGEDFKGQRMQRVARQHGGCLPECAVHRGLAPAHIVIVHARQIVMDQRIDMDRLHRRSDAQRDIAVDMEQRSGRSDQQGPQPFAAANRRMAHRGIERIARIAGQREQPVKFGVYIRSNLAQRVSCNISGQPASKGVVPVGAPSGPSVIASIRAFAASSRCWHSARNLLPCS